MTKYLWPLVTSLFIILLGATLLILPFALHANVRGWSSGSTSDFWTGLGVIVVGLLMMLGWYAQLRRELINRGIIEIPQPNASSPNEAVFVRWFTAECR